MLTPFGYNPQGARGCRFEKEGVDLSLLTTHPELQEKLTPLMKGLATKLVLEALDCSAISLGRAKELLTRR